MVTTKVPLKNNLENFESTIFFLRTFVAFTDFMMNFTRNGLQKHGFHLFSKRIPISRGKIQSVLKEKIDSEIIKKLKNTKFVPYTYSEKLAEDYQYH